jgi:hypothetical protein
MREDFLRGSRADHSGWTTTKVAAQALGIDPRTVRKYIKQGKLVAKSEGEGVEKTYLVSIDSVYAMRETRTGPRADRVEGPREGAENLISADLVSLVRDLTSQISQRSSEAADLRARLELTERAESSQREALEQRLEAERLLRAEAERERDELRTRLEALKEAPQTPETTAEEPERTNTPDRGEGSQEATARPSWWRRFFGFE